MSEVVELFPEIGSAGDLPRPGRERFQLQRAGIFNLWQYDEQELRFEDGRLILRGENGAGKSKALELLLPFLLDADLSPQRLDPFGGTSRTMEWNLLQDGRYDSRVGYVWLELGRRTEEGDDEHWTLGCGLRASQRTRRVDSWYFLTRLRIGEGLALLSHRTPLLRDQLRQQIGEQGWVFDTGREYREKLDHHLFGLGEDRFATLRHLLLQLRRPHLSERLDPPTLSETLKESLPPLDPFLIGQLSESFERLDNDQKELARVESAAAGVASFLDLYRDYGRGMARSRAAEVRQADSRYHRTAAEMREAEEGYRSQDALCAELARREQETEVETEAARGRLRALEQSDAMRSAEALRAKRETAAVLARQAARSRDDSEMESRRAEGLRRELERAEAGARQADDERDDRSAAAQAAGREADLEVIHAAGLQALDRPPAALATVRSAVRRREEGIAELRQDAAELDRVRLREELAREGLRDLDAQVRAAAERSRAARVSLDRQRADLHEALLSWSQGLAELRLDDEAFANLQERIEEIAAGGPDRLASGVEVAAAPFRDALVRRQAELESEAATVDAERQATEEERLQVAEARELGPEPPRTRVAERAGRPGAPLYLLCDFAPGLAEVEQAGLEAALEAAGLLDAWIAPDGAMLSPGTLDTWLVPAPLQAGPTLRDVLVPAPGHGVASEALDAVLRSVDLGEGLQSISADGHFRLGILQGAGSKPVAEHVGAGAREAARQRRLAELDARLAALAERLASLAAQVGELEARLERLRQETGSLPSTAPLLAAWHQAEAAAGDEARRRSELAVAESALAALRAVREDLERRLQARARELGLANHLNDLDGHRERLRQFETAFERLVQAASAAVQAREHCELAGRRADEAVGRLEELRLRAQEIAADAEAARAEHEELEATVGADVREILRLHQEEARRLDDLRTRRRVLEQEARAAAEQRARFQERLELRRAELAGRDEERARAVARLRTIVDAGWLPLVLSVLPEEPAWSLTRALDLAREIDRETREVDLAQEAADRRAKRLWERFQILAADLGADYQPRLDQDEELILVRVAFNGRDHDVKGLLDALRESIEVRRALLADHERELLRRFLLGEVGDHLRNRLRQARSLVGEMNDLLERCRTASGMALKLAWDPVAESAPEVRDAVGLLNRDFALLQDAERLRLEAFFQARISAARDQWEAVPWREHLMAALDYRSWYRFRILRRTGESTDWIELTRRGHGASSGGEKAVALHLPLFAAAAAHYRSARPTAPRLILLDEAFAGIDQGMRGRCMGLLVALDLDFLMTSHDEWGCYEELPAVATYQLYRDPALEGVAAVRMVWHGRDSTE
ncbi:MAG: TIGR02680 family protein [Acidobacteriota bacterium]